MLLTNQKTINHNNLSKNFREPPLSFLIGQRYFKSLHNYKWFVNFNSLLIKSWFIIDNFLNNMQINGGFATVTYTICISSSTAPYSLVKHKNLSRKCILLNIKSKFFFII